MPMRASRTSSSGSRSRDAHETEHLLAELKRHRIEAYDLTDNEMAKLHVRHLVGGHAPAAENEILYRFEFPERPGALMRFLNSMSRGWNISLFHYRNHGADYGRVLVGMQVPPSDKGEFRDLPRPAGLRLRRRDRPIPRTGCFSAADRRGAPRGCPATARRAADRRPSPGLERASATRGHAP